MLLHVPEHNRHERFLCNLVKKRQDVLRLSIAMQDAGANHSGTSLTALDQCSNDGDGIWIQGNYVLRECHAPIVSSLAAYEKFVAGASCTLAAYLLHVNLVPARLVETRKLSTFLRVVSVSDFHSIGQEKVCCSNYTGTARDSFFTPISLETHQPL